MEMLLAAFGCVDMLVSSWFSVRIVPLVNVYLMYLWGEMSSYSAILITFLTATFRSDNICEKYFIGYKSVRI